MAVEIQIRNTNEIEDAEFLGSALSNHFWNQCLNSLNSLFWEHDLTSIYIYVGSLSRLLISTLISLFIFNSLIHLVISINPIAPLL